MQNKRKTTKATMRASGKIHTKKLSSLESEIRRVLGDVKEDLFGFAIDLSTIASFKDMVENMYSVMTVKKRQSFDKIINDFADNVAKKLCEFRKCPERKHVEKAHSFVFDPSHNSRPPEKHIVKNGVMISYVSTETKKTGNVGNPQTESSSVAAHMMSLFNQKQI